MEPFARSTKAQSSSTVLRQLSQASFHTARRSLSLGMMLRSALPRRVQPTFEGRIGQGQRPGGMLVAFKRRRLPRTLSGRS